MNAIRKLFSETGLRSLSNSPIDVKILCLQRLVRLFAYGGSTLILALYLSDLHNSDQRIGLFMTLTLWGDVILSFILTLVADSTGRKRMLVLGSLLMTASGVVFATSSSYWVLVIASVFGVISPSGAEIGPFKAIEESAISQLVSADDRSTVLAWYYMLGTWGSASGALCAGWVVKRLQDGQWSTIESYRIIFMGYAAMGVTKCVLSIALSSRCERDYVLQEQRTAASDEIRPLLALRDNEECCTSYSYRTVTPQFPPGASFTSSVSSRDSIASFTTEVSSSSTSATETTNTTTDAGKDTPSPLFSAPRPGLSQISYESRWLLLKICLIFMLDNLGSGIIPESWQTLYFQRKFHLEEGALGSLFFTSRFLTSFSNLYAIPIVHRLGLIPTMILGHVPAAICLALIPLPTLLPASAGLLVVRALFLDIDQAPRQAFLAAAFAPTERTAVLGFINVIRTLCQSVGPLITGVLASVGQLWLCFVVAGVLKLVYDGLLLGTFVGYRTYEERVTEEQD
ncbi:hypothetical protein H2199_009127 [Coniosporium tulheliwenetii]|uniref:Uncharacterized protein n=2 Tax=Coniosporium tulheliwenetii TaxID=3383036 RepID=A0ACC2YFF2_9PEZI|nr:hypothetical protein H2199_009127 [Cladosporium sp. JES 115]